MLRQPSLVGFWPLDDVQRTTGNGDGYVNPQWVTGAYGLAIALTELMESVQADAMAAQEINQVTMAAWSKQRRPAVTGGATRS